MPDLTLFLWGRALSGGPVMGLVVNLGLSGVALALGMLLGVPLGVLRAGAPGYVRAPLGLALGVIRGTPLLLLVLWTFLFVQVVLALPLAPLGVACLALGLYALTHVSDIVRAGVLAVSSSEVRSAQALGLSRLQIARAILVPVALRVMLPALTSFATTLFKDSSVCYIIGVVDLVQLALLETGRRPSYLLEYYALMAFLFLIVSLVGTRAAARLERRYRLPGSIDPLEKAA